MRREEYREFAKADYLGAVARAKEYIAAGDVMQVQIGQRIRKPYADAPLSLYRALRTLNPSPYMYFYNFGDFHVVGASPEILVRSEDREGKRMVAIRPIAGTRPRGNTPEQDAILAAELAADPKERAEHLMLIDLARNDIGRIAEIGSVKVTEQYVIEKYSHVQHLVSHVEGVLKPGMTNLDVLRATFPAGTLSGAPKVRAMENHRRARARQARHLRRGGGLSLLRRRYGPRHRDPHRHHQGQRALRPGRRRHRRGLDTGERVERDRGQGARGAARRRAGRRRF